jgi:hypothetical protein
MPVGLAFPAGFALFRFIACWIPNYEWKFNKNLQCALHQSMLSTAKCLTSDCWHPLPCQSNTHFEEIRGLASDDYSLARLHRELIESSVF